MKGRFLVWPVLALLAWGLFAQTGRALDRLRGAVLLRQVELVLMAAAQHGQASPRLLPDNLERLRLAGRWSPTEVGVPIARGSQYLLFGHLQSAIDAYESAAAFEPKPEIYLNLGRAHFAAGHTEEARKNFALALRLDPRLAAAVPAELREAP